jgi:Tfp pilus assembly protein PilE
MNIKNNKQFGLTLLQLMSVIAIIGVILTIIYQ